MRFNSLEYLILLLTTVVLFFNLPRKGRLVLLIASSLIFYAFWNVPLVSLIVISALTDFAAGHMIGCSNKPGTRRLFLLLSICVNLGLLGYFKYANFFIENVHALLGDSREARYLDIILPPGISFYTFQTMSYTIDVYRRKITPTHSFLRFFLYVSFFPQLVAGPIERASHLLTQFDYVVTNRFSSANFVTGIRMIVWGLFKKIIFADYCAQIVDHYYGNPAAMDGWSAIVATYAFTLQLYCDFSAYSEIARGSARLFGVDIMQNFDQPYLSTSVGESWRRWHISLSTWIRDYIYIPLGGSRKGTFRTLVNIVVTMFLSGLWHGADWHFAFWGFFVGFTLVAEALLSKQPVVRRMKASIGRAWPFVGWWLTFHAFALGWVIFRSQSMGNCVVTIQRMGCALVSCDLPNAAQAAFLGFVALFLFGSFVSRRYRLFDRIHRDTGLSVVFYGLLIGIMLLFAKPDGPQFIYFQF
ncbi:MAG TPA: MBOAT family O-acyltransferase [Candidatus Hydrogenedentes bacterium]|nr:MBOAT family O-acyltransferase [Candidatus Hydrogenedentota bacterium]HPG69202.1 MBOAT family O-acyltransferase [Candidatus Hydrogenedentota bacterium]